jgi:hypothetical protein
VKKAERDSGKPGLTSDTRAPSATRRRGTRQARIAFPCRQIGT